MQSSLCRTDGNVLVKSSYVSKNMLKATNSLHNCNISAYFYSTAISNIKNIFCTSAMLGAVILVIRVDGVHWLVYSRSPLPYTFKVSDKIHIGLRNCIGYSTQSLLSQ